MLAQAREKEKLRQQGLKRTRLGRRKVVVHRRPAKPQLKQHGAAEKRFLKGCGQTWRSGEAEEYAADLLKMAEEYQARNEAGECFVHVRKNTQVTKT